jgi:hypothetical protein
MKTGRGEVPEMVTELLAALGSIIEFINLITNKYFN